jgi:hypothetical protein
MRTCRRLFLFAVACVALLAGFACAFARWGGASFQAWDLPEAGRELLTETRRQQDLQEKDAAALRRLEGKRDVTNALLAGRLSLRRAVELFRQIDEDNPGAADAQATADDSSVYDNVLTWAAAALTDKPDGSAVLARLEAERRMIEEGGAKSL